MKKLVSLIYPFTKAKLRRALNFAGTLLAAAAVVAVWLSSIDAGEKVGATIVLVTTFLTRAKGAIQKLEAGVDSLPIPADDEPTKPFPQPRSNTPLIALLAIGTALLLASCAGPQKVDPRFECAGLATVDNAPELVAIVLQCSAIAVSPAAVFPCVQAAAAAKWPREVLACFYDAHQGRVQCPAYSKAKGGGQ